MKSFDEELREILKGFNIRSCNAKDCPPQLHDGLTDQALLAIKKLTGELLDKHKRPQNTGNKYINEDNKRINQALAQARKDSSSLAINLIVP